MKNGKSPHFYLAIFWFLIALTAFCSGATPERPYYSETPNPRHIQNNDRLTAEYFNNQLNVIYNWAQRTHTELDNLLHNGVGVASLTVGILNCTNKIINPEWDNLLHNGNGVASITANLVKTQDLEISNKIDVPAIEFSGRSQPTPPVNNGLLYFDSDLQRFRVYQENAWRDLSSNYVINGTTLTNPLIIDGYLDTRNIYINENASITKNLNVQGNINSSGTATVTSLNTDKVLKVPTSASTTLGIGSIYYDTTAGKLKAYNGTSWDIVGKDITVDSAMSDTSTNPVQNKIAKSYIDTQDDKTLASATKKFVSAIATGDNNGTIKVTKNGSSSNVSVKGLGTAAYANVASFSAPTHNHDSSYAAKNHNHDSSYVSAITTGDNNGTIKVTKNGSSSNIAVKGLGSAAYANVASFSTPITIDSSISSSSTNPVQNKIIKSYVDDLNQLVTNNYVYNVQEGDTDGTIKITRGLHDYSVRVKGLGSAAFANVASLTPQSSSTAPSNPYLGQTFFDITDNVLKYWNGTIWVSLKDSSATTNSNSGQNLILSGDIQILFGGPNNGTVTFDNPFSGDPFIVTGSCGGPFEVYVGSVSSSSFAINGSGYENTANWSTPAYWIAIGKKGTLP